ncbi:AgrD family cyclic lactone autoinducer peptide [Clostridium aminobutyricum]|uniref:Cyclic lactone autoinducer peptide n=1 Tax=Clostridium aminobutyricum TaxID=33953 RepID=A0A939D735_CLOAM|nr:cyclic lactone autoinducer peptide [Clostridium aminobutyricum]MBN7771948.1 cyclic lactone autoinducer peptide [Clostridium aminobutyricum]
MFQKLKRAFMSSTALFLIGVATTTISAASISHHGEPDCPKELLK